MFENYLHQSDLMFAAGNYSMAGKMCYAEFLQYYYYLIYNSVHNGNQPKDLTDNLLEDSSLCSPVIYSKVLPLMSTKVETALPQSPICIEISCG